MGAGAGFKTFVTGDVLTAADTNGYLMQGVWVFASAAARDAAVTSPQEGNFCYLKDTNATLYYTGSAWATVGGGGGKVLQVVNSIFTTEVSSTTSTFADTGLTATITPSAATSKVLVLATMATYKDISNTGVSYRLIRTSTAIANTSNAAYTGNTGGVDVGSVALNYQDSPATTSATVYKVQFASDSNSSRAIINRGGIQANASSITLLEIGA
jgi:hypothetical protein